MVGSCESYLVEAVKLVVWDCIYPKHKTKKQQYELSKYIQKKHYKAKQNKANKKKSKANKKGKTKKTTKNEEK